MDGALNERVEHIITMVKSIGDNGLPWRSPLACRMGGMGIH